MGISAASRTRRWTRSPGSGRISSPSCAAPSTVKPPAERLYGRTRGKTLRPRQERLLGLTLPRLLYPEALAPGEVFPGREIWFEVGFGGGEHAQALAEAHPEAALIACEVFENGICSLLSRLVAEGAEETGTLPANLRLFPDDARLLLRRLPDSCLSKLFLMFPDPWPKARHAKRRFVHPEQLALVARVLRPGGEWRVASDDPTYQDWVDAVMAEQALFTHEVATTERPPGWPPTRYERRALHEGRPPRYWSFRRSLSPSPAR